MPEWKEVAKNVKVKSRWMAFRLKEKNRRIAVMNRLRMVVRCEEKAAEKEYLALGRYYYNALRNPDNAITESHCARIDQINARRDSALESLERHSQAESIGIIGGEDGPTAVFMAGRLNDPVFHCDHGPSEITVSRESAYDPADKNSEEIDLSDVACYDSDPTLLQREAAVSAAMEDKPSYHGAELSENDHLPFE